MIKPIIKQYVLNELIPHPISELSDDFKLISDGVIDSITTLQLVDYIEKQFGIEFEPHEVDRDNLDSLDQMEVFILSKQ